MIVKADLRIKDSNFYKSILFKDEPTTYTITDEDVYDPGRIAIMKDLPFELWSVIMRMNNVVDPFNDLIPGLVLYIPTLRELKKIELGI
jgi:hypothetical protein